MFPLKDEHIHDLAVAYAQVKLQHYQEEYGKTCDEDELHEYAKAYKFALVHFEEQYNSLD
ncbi:hypothetical protein [[Clostridium] symbiosum]|uniref:hypothetical protein n=1 Tax=Clostridium symbiosum TaxID=1512 RepID=UPI00189BC53A|nr:hypothetical protein [[Clostridium] symbiosum]